MNQNNNSCEFKNISTSMNCLKIKTLKYDEVVSDVKKIKKKIREFFETTPMLIDFGGCDIKDISYIYKVHKFLTDEGFLIIGVKNLKDKYKTSLKEENKIPVFSNSKPSGDSENLVTITKKKDGISKQMENAIKVFGEDYILNKIKEEEKEKKEEIKDISISGKSKIIKDVVRKGQQVVNGEGDVLIFGSLNNGAEAVSSGSVVITELAEGKIFAGVGFNDAGEGDDDAVVYIERFNAHLVSINGIYKKFETVPDELYMKRVLITLKNEILEVRPLSG